MAKFIVCGLDVWGHEPGGPDCECEHECEGYWVNDVHKAGSVELGENDDAAQVMFDEGFISTADRELVEVIDDGCGFIEINDAKTGMPVFQLREE